MLVEKLPDDSHNQGVCITPGIGVPAGAQDDREQKQTTCSVPCLSSWPIEYGPKLNGGSFMPMSFYVICYTRRDDQNGFMMNLISFIPWISLSRQCGWNKTGHTNSLRATQFSRKSCHSSSVDGRTQGMIPTNGLGSYGTILRVPIPAFQQPRICLRGISTLSYFHQVWATRPTLDLIPANIHLCLEEWIPLRNLEERTTYLSDAWTLWKSHTHLVPGSHCHHVHGIAGLSCYTNHMPPDSKP